MKPDRDIFGLSPTAIVHLDSQMRVLRANPSAQKAFGLLDADAPPRDAPEPSLRPFAIAAPDAWATLQAPLQRVLATGEALTFWGYPSPSSSDESYFDITIVATGDSVDGRELLIFANSSTERVRAEHSVQTLVGELRKAVKKLDATLEQMTDGVVVTDATGRVMTQNRAASSMLGDGSHAHAYSTPDGEALAEDKLPWRRAADAGTEVRDFELVTRNDGDSAKTVSINAAPLRTEAGALDGAVAVLRDVTSQRAMLEELRRTNEQLQEFNRLKAEFVANMSHELRTPLTAVIGFTQLALMKEKSGTATIDVYRDVNARVLRNAAHLLALVDEVLDLSRLEAGRIDLHPQYIDPQKLLQDVVDSLLSLAQQRRLEFGCTVLGDVPLAWVDPIRVKQIVVNLVSNALKFTSQGGVYVTLSASADIALEVAVRDTGPGIDEAHRAMIFERFRQVDGALTRRVGGTGLGLSIASELARLMGGEIRVASEVGKGSTFTVTIPRSLPVESAADGATALSIRPARDGARTVVVVEDSDDAAAILTTTLSDAGYRVVRACRVAEALEAVRAEKPVAITLDVMLPDRDGWSALSELKSDPKTRSIPVLITSILDNQPLAYRLGAADYLRKPVSPERVLAALRRVGASSDPGAENRSSRILIIDDEHSVREILAETVSEIGLTPLIAASGAEALSLLRTEKPLAILLDLMMPGMSGYEVFARLKNASETAGIPVIIISGQDIDGDGRALLRNQVQKVIHKGELLVSNLPDTLRSVFREVGIEVDE